MECFERGAQPFESSAHRFCSSAKAKSEVLRLLEEFSWHYAGFKLFAQNPDKFGSAARPEPRKHRRAEAAWLTIELRMFNQGFVHQHTIGFKQRTGASTHPIEIVQGNYCQQFGRMHRASVCEINDLPHALDQFRLRQNPSAANAAQPYALVKLLVTTKFDPR